MFRAHQFNQEILVSTAGLLQSGGWWSVHDYQFCLSFPSPGDQPSQPRLQSTYFLLVGCMVQAAPLYSCKRTIGEDTITENASTRAFSWLKDTIKTLC